MLGERSWGEPKVRSKDIIPIEAQQIAFPYFPTNPEKIQTTLIPKPKTQSPKAPNPSANLLGSSQSPLHKSQGSFSKEGVSGFYKDDMRLCRDYLRIIWGYIVIISGLFRDIVRTSENDIHNYAIAFYPPSSSRSQSVVLFRNPYAAKKY